jgi:hypothetical protein
MIRTAANTAPDPYTFEERSNYTFVLPIPLPQLTHLVIDHRASDAHSIRFHNGNEEELPKRNFRDSRRKERTQGCCLSWAIILRCNFISHANIDKGVTVGPYPKLSYLVGFDRVESQSYDIDPIGYFMRGTSVLQQVHTDRLRPSWCLTIRDLQCLTHLSFRCPSPYGTRDSLLWLYTNNIETDYDDLRVLVKRALLKIAQNTSIHSLHIRWHNTHLDADEEVQQEDIDTLVKSSSPQAYT